MESSIFIIILVSLYHLETSVKGDIFPSSKDGGNTLTQNDDYIISMIPINDQNAMDCNGNDAAAMGNECNQSSMEILPISSMSIDGSRNMIMLKFEEPKTLLRIKNEKAGSVRSNQMGNVIGMAKTDFMRLGKRHFEKLPLLNVPVREIRGEGMRDSRGDSFMRFGRLPRTSADFMRFGRDAGNFMRFGRTAKQQSYQTRSNNNFMRLGRPDNFMRFGRSSPPSNDENFMRFGKSLSEGGENNTQRDRLHTDKVFGYHNNKALQLFNKGTDEDMETDYLEN